MIPSLANGSTGAKALSIAGTWPSRGAWSVLVLSVVTLVAVAQSPTVAVLVKWLVDPLFHSTSLGATVTLCGAAAVAALRLISAAPARADAPLLRVGCLLLVVILCGQVANIAGHIAYARAHDIPLSQHFLHWDGTQNTYSYVLHSHAGKAALAALLRGLIAPGAGFDFGQAWGEAIPWPVAVVCAISIGAASVLALWLLPALAQRHGGSPALICIYFFSAVNCIKTIADGGPLTYRFLPCYVALGVIVALTSRTHGRKILRRAVPLIAITALLYGLLWWHYARGEGGAAVQSLAITLALICVPAAASLRLRSRSARAGRWLAQAAIIGWLALVYAHDLEFGIGRLLLPLPSDYRATIVDLEQETARVIPAAGRTPLELYLESGDDPFKPRQVYIAREVSAAPYVMTVGLKAYSGHPAARSTVGARSALIELIAARNLDLPQDTALLAVRFDPLRLPFYADESSATLAQNNYYCRLHLVAAALRHRGLQSFALLPVLDRAGIAALTGRPGSSAGS